MSLLITEILEPCEQGRTRPYKCRGEDGWVYFVKGRQTDRASLWHEWICGHLARRLGLNVPPFAIVDITLELLSEAPPAWREMGVGPAFGSRQHPATLWVEQASLDAVPVAMQRDLLVYDWWVRNGDRLTGNTNLLWDVEARELVVIDHNLAFDADFARQSFLVHHVFAHQWQCVTTDLVACAEYVARLSECLDVFDEACQSAPEEWRWANDERDVPANVDLSAIRKILHRCEHPDFWNAL